METLKQHGKKIVRPTLVKPFQQCCLDLRGACSRVTAIYLKYVMAALIFVGGGMIGAPAQALDIEYHPRFGAIPLDDEVRAAIETFPDVASCLKPGSVKNGTPDLDAIDWRKIRNDGDAKVCLFMIFERLGGPEPVKAWLQRMKFEVFGPSEVSWLTSGQAKHFGYKSQSIIGLSANWSLEGQFPIFPTQGMGKYIRRTLSRTQIIEATWFPDGKLMEVSIIYNSIFN